MANSTRNGYEIRADLLGLAKQIAEFNYSIKYNEYETTVRKEGDQVVSEFKYPTIQAEDIIETAKKFNDFVTNNAPQYNETAKVLMENVQNYTQNVQKQMAENMKPEAIQENVKKFQENIKKASEAFFNGVK
jgi:gas vesicle protein